MITVACLTSLVALNGKNHAGTGTSAAFTVTQPLERAAKTTRLAPLYPGNGCEEAHSGGAARSLLPDVRREGGCCQLLSVEIPRGHALAPNACASSRARSAPLLPRGMFRGPGTRGRQGLDSRTRY